VRGNYVRGDIMRKLMVSQFKSLDVVTQARGGEDGYRGGAFEHLRR